MSSPNVVYTPAVNVKIAGQGFIAAAGARRMHTTKQEISTVYTRLAVSCLKSVLNAQL